jgi:4-amino-4-deoxy-L-arabinose transferase-like glycosyltransferase
LSLAITFFSVATLVWINLDTVPPLWDQAQYLSESELLYHTLRQQGLISFASAFSAALGTKAPLVTVLPLPFYLLMGESHLSARYVNVLFIILASWYLFRLGEIVAGRRAALLSVILLNTFPMIAGVSRQFLVEFGLMTLVIMWMYYLVRWRQDEKKRHSWALGIILGLGMLMKVTFPLYVALPAVLVLAQDALRHRRLRLAIQLHLARMAAAAVPLAGIWYFKNWSSVGGFVIKAGYSGWAHKFGKGDVFSLRTIGAYWLDLVNLGIGAYCFLLLVMVVGWVGLGLRWSENRLGASSNHLHVLLAWWIFPWLMLTFAVNKDPRFSVPYLPALALVLGAGFAGVTRLKFHNIGLAAVAALSLFNYVYYSFVARPGGFELRTAGLILVGGNLSWAHPPKSEHWPNEGITRMIAADAAALGIARPKATLLFSHPHLSSHNLNYVAALLELPVTFDHFWSPESESPGEFASRVRARSDYLLLKSGALAKSLVNAKSAEALPLLRAGGLPFDRIGTVGLPDQTEVAVFRRKNVGVFSRIEKTVGLRQK